MRPGLRRRKFFFHHGLKALSSSHSKLCYNTPIPQPSWEKVKKSQQPSCLLYQSSPTLFRAIIQTGKIGVTWIWTYNFCNYIMCLCCVSHLNGKRCLALGGWVFRVSYLEYGWLTWNSVIGSKTLKMPLTGSVNEFFLFSLHCIRLLILPWVSVSLSHCVLLACFPPYVHLHTPSATFFFSHAPCLSCLPLFSFDWS